MNLTAIGNSMDKKLTGFIFALSLIPLALHLYTNLFASYGIFRDELYYLSCASRPALGYVDQPPFSIYILAIIKLLIGDSLLAIRLLPALMHSATVFITGLIVKELNGGKLAAAYACIAMALAPIYLAMHTVYSMNIFDFLFWTLTYYLIIKIVKNSNPKLWMKLGVVLGLGLLNKIGILWLCAGLFLGLLLTPQRKELKTKWPWISAVIALMIFSPYIIWNITHDFAHLEFIRNASQYKYSGLSPVDFVVNQFLILNPGSAIIWLAGIYFFFFNKEGKNFKLAGIIYVISFLVLVLNGTSKAEYLAPAYSAMFAGGGVLLEQIDFRKYWKWLKYAVLIPLAISGIILIPIVLPILPVDKFIHYAESIGFGPSSSENKELAELPQFYADMFGWEDLAKTISGIYLSLPDEQRKNTVVYGRNYGEVAAVEYYSKKYPLPEAVSPHNSFYFWSLGKDDVTTVIVIGGVIEDHLNAGHSVDMKTTYTSKYIMPYENNLPIFVITDLFRTIDEIMETDRHYE